MRPGRTALNGAAAPTLNAEERARLRRVNGILFRELSASSQDEVRLRAASLTSVTLQQNA